jgi:hypothetical protein
MWMIFDSNRTTEPKYGKNQRRRVAAAEFEQRRIFVRPPKFSRQKFSKQTCSSPEGVSTANVLFRKCPCPFI